MTAKNQQLFEQFYLDLDLYVFRLPVTTKGSSLDAAPWFRALYHFENWKCLKTSWTLFLPQPLPPAPPSLYYSFYKDEIKKWCAQIILVTLLVSKLSLEVFWAFRERQHELGKNYFKSAPLVHLENCTKMSTKKLLQKPNKYQNWSHINHKVTLNITTQKHIFPCIKCCARAV